MCYLKNLGFALAILVAGTVQAEQTTVIVDGVEQSNQGSVNSTGAFNQYNLGGGGQNFGGQDIPVYQRKGDVSCAVATFSAKAYGIQRHLSQGALQVGVNIPLTGRRCLNAFDDAVEATIYELHVKKVEQRKQDVLFQTKMFDVCRGMHLAGYVVAIDNPLFEACQQFQPSEANHGPKHAKDPQVLGFGKPSAHEQERLEHLELHHPHDFEDEPG